MWHSKQYWEKMRTEYSRHIAFRYIDRSSNQIEEITYEQYQRDICCCIGFMSKKTESLREKHIGILAGNSYSYQVCMSAIMKAEAVVIPLNVEKSNEELLCEITESDMDYLFYDEKHEVAAKQLFQQRTQQLWLLSDYKTAEPKEAEAALDKDKLALIMFTSGTTGKSKGVMYSFRGLQGIIDGYSQYFMSVKNRLVIPYVNAVHCLPMYHMFSFVMIAPCIEQGQTVSLCNQVERLRKELPILKGNCIGVVPMILELLYKSVKRGKMDVLGGIKEILCAGAPGNPELFLYFQEKDIHISQAYGMTEILNGTRNVSEDPSKIKSVGCTFFDSQVKIENQEVLLSSAGRMLGYYKRPDATKEVIEDNWIHTGDLGWMDEDGYLYLMGRKNNLIILSSGENINPEELEGLLSKCSLIKEAIIREKGNKICAEIYTESDEQEEILAFVEKVNKEVALYKRITAVEFREQPFERTGSGKIKRSKLMEDNKNEKREYC